MGILQDLRDPNNREAVQTLLEVVKTLGLVFTAAGLILTYCDAQEDRRLTQERLVTDRFSKAIEQLGEEKDETVRIGGIYSLERIAKDSPRDYWTIMEILTSYARKNSPIPEKEEEIKPIDIDVQAALTVIGRRHITQTQRHLKKLEEGKIIDLTNTFLARANLAESNLAESNLAESNLARANLAESNLARANLAKANLAESNLARANLTNTNFTKANLEKADLVKANLLNANLTGANLREAKLAEVNLADAILEEAGLFCANLSKAKNLTIEQVKSARNWKTAIYDKNFQQKLGLQPTSQDNSC